MNLKVKNLAMVALLAGLSMTTPQTQASVKCTTDQNKITYLLGVHPNPQNLIEIPGQVPGGAGHITQIFNNFIIQDAQGHSSTQSINLDLTNHTISTDFADGQILSTTDVSKGIIDYELCLDKSVSAVLTHAIYRADGNNSTSELKGITSTMGHIQQGIIQTIANNATLLAIAGDFNLPDSQGLTGTDRLTNLFNEYATNQVDETPAQQAFTFSLQFTTSRSLKNTIQVTNENNALIEGNTIYVTGSNASVQNTNAVVTVENENGESVISHGNILSNLENSIGQNFVQKTMHGKKKFSIAEGRTELLADNTYACEPGTHVNIEARFKYNDNLSDEHLILTHMKTSDVIKAVSNNEITHSVPCDDKTYRVTGEKLTTEGNLIGQTHKTVNIIPNNTATTKVIGLDLNGDDMPDLFDADRDGTLDTPINVQCDTSTPHSFTLITNRPSNNFNGIDLPEGTDLNQTTGVINYNTDCSEAGLQFSPRFRADNGAELKMLFIVRDMFFSRGVNPVYQSPVGLAGDPSVIKDNGSIIMYYSAEGGIAVVMSSDNGVTWNPPDNSPNDYIALEPQQSGWDNTLETIDVLKVGNEYWMYYTGYREGEGDNTHVENYEIGLAISQDGINFTRISESLNQPILARDLSNENTFDRHAMTSPAIIYDSGMYHMIYAGWNVTNDWTGANAGIRIMGATSSDGINWQKIEEPILEPTDIEFSPDVNEASLIKSDDGFWIIPFSTGSSIGIARSRSFIGEYDIYPRTIVSPSYGWDGEVTAPDGFIENGKIRLWFHGVKTPEYWPWVIGYAEADYPFNWNE